MNNIKTLLFLDISKIKNMILQIFRNPMLFIKKFFSVVIFMGLCYSSLIISIFKNHSKTSINFQTKESILGISGLLSLIIFLLIISYYLNDYAPSNFSISDISYLFPSPIDSKFILFYSMVRSALKGVGNFFLTIIFFILLILAFTNLSLIGLIPIALGFFFIFLFFISMSYLLFAIKIKFNAIKKLKIISYIMKGLVVLILLVYIFKLYSLNFNFYLYGESLYNSFITKLPIVSSIVNLISILLEESITLPIIDIIFLLILVIFNCSAFLYLNVDYYEEISEKVSTLNERLKKLKSNKPDVHSEIEKKIKKVNVNSYSKERYGVLSLYWKASLIRKRKQTSIKKYLYFIINIIIGVAGGYFTLKGSQLYSLISISLGTIYILLISSSYSELSRELKNMYIYLIPGKPINKILSTALDELLILFIRISIMLIPTILLDGKYLLLGVGLYIITLAATLETKLLNLIFILLMPKEDNTSPSFLSTFVLMIVMVIPFICTAISYAIFKNIYISFSILFILISIYLCLLVLLSNKIFDYIEY